MKNRIKPIVLLFFCIVCITCKKSTALKIKLFNPALNEYVPNATVALVQRKTRGGISGGGYECSEIATAITDADGECTFNKEKLRTNNKYDYYVAVKESWGVEQSYPCSGRSSGFITKWGTQDLVVTDEVEGSVRVQYNNLLKPSQPGDSLVVSLSTIEYPNPEGGVVQGGGGVFGDWENYNVNNPPNYPSVILTDAIKTKGQRLKRLVRKHKLGVITQFIDTIKVYPNQTTTVVIDW